MLRYAYKMIASVDFCALRSYKLLDSVNMHVSYSKEK